MDVVCYVSSCFYHNKDILQGVKHIFQSLNTVLRPVESHAMECKDLCSLGSVWMYLGRAR